MPPPEYVHTTVFAASPFGGRGLPCQHYNPRVRYRTEFVHMRMSYLVFKRDGANMGHYA